MLLQARRALGAGRFAVTPLGTAVLRLRDAACVRFPAKSAGVLVVTLLRVLPPLGYRTQGYGLGGVCSARAAEVRARLGALSPGTPCWATCQRGVSDSAVSHVVGASVFSDHAQPSKVYGHVSAALRVRRDLCLDGSPRGAPTGWVRTGRHTTQNRNLWH